MQPIPSIQGFCKRLDYVAYFATMPGCPCENAIEVMCDGVESRFYGAYASIECSCLQIGYFYWVGHTDVLPST